MGLASALSTALTGLSASETTIDVVGNNLANSNTVGFKESQAAFATQFLQTQSMGSAPTDTSGGTDPRQIGLGTMAAEITPNFNQGTIEVSTNPTDLAIQGDGFFIVQGGSGAQVYTRNGQFKLNSDNQMVTITGNRVLGFGVDDNYNLSTTTLQPITIPLGTAAVAQATANAFLQGTLSPSGTVGSAGTILETDILDDAAYTQPGATTVPEALSVPVTPNAAVAANGSLADGDYVYKIAYADLIPSSGNPSMPRDISSASLATVSVHVSGTNKSIQLSGLPTLPDGTKLAIYRTDNTGSGDFDFLKAITSTDISSGAWTDTGATALSSTPLAATPTLNGSYKYYVVYANGTIESRPQQVVGTSSFGGTQILLSNLPTDTSGEWTSTRIYRSVNIAGDTNYYRVTDIPGVPTSSLSFIDSASDTTIKTGGIVMKLNGPKIDAANTKAVDLLRWNGTGYDTLFTADTTFRFTGHKGDRALTPKEMSITAGTTVQNVLDFMSGAMGVRYDTGDGAIATVTNDGRMEIEGNYGNLNALRVDLSGMQLVSSSGTASIDLPFNETQKANGESAMTDFVAYDSLGTALNVHITAVLVGRDSTSTTYRWYADSPQNTKATDNFSTSVGSGTIKFDGSGSYMSNTNAKVQIYRGDSPAQSPLVFSFDFNQLSGLSSDKSTLAVSRQDGSASGTLNSFIVGEDGLIRGVFSNGVTRDLGQIRLARFANPNGLQQKGENLYASGVNSGLPVEGNPGEQGAGTIVAGATELSNTDVGGNLIDLILASTMYRGNARVITTIQQMFDELMNLRR